MATDRSNADKNQPADKNDASPSKQSGESSMKERLLAQRRAQEAAESAGAPPVPAARPTTSPAAARAQAAAAAARAAPAAKPEPAKAAAPAPASAASRRPVQLSAAKEEERGARREKRGASPEVLREVEMLRKQQDKWIMYGWIVAGGLMLIAGAVYFVVHNKKTAIEDAARIRKAQVVAFKTHILALDEHKPADNDSILKELADPANDGVWKTDEENIYALLSAKRGAAQRERDRLKAQQDLMQGLAELEATCSGASSKSADDLAKARRRVQQYEIEGTDLDNDVKLRLTKVHLCIDKAYVARLHEEAKALIAKGPTEARNALTAIQKAEDEIVHAVDDALKSHKDVETVTYYQDQLKSIIPEGDELVKQIFTPDVIERTPWTDLLADSQKSHWQQIAFKGWELKNGVLSAVGPDLDARAIAIMSIGDQEQWRDYVFECEFAILKGESSFHFRLGPSVNNTTITVQLSSLNGNPPYKAGQPYTATATVLASTFKFATSDGDHNPMEDNDLHWVIRRKGGIGISVPPGSEIKITKMRIKVLR